MFVDKIEKARMLKVLHVNYYYKVFAFHIVVNKASQKCLQLRSEMADVMWNMNLMRSWLEVEGVT